ncbi:MAG: ATP-binding protein [Patescibacteria group bacterium]
MEKEPLGTGLGLYLLKSLVDKLGGKVWFESKEGEGSIFYVNLR